MDSKCNKKKKGTVQTQTQACYDFDAVCFTLVIDFLSCVTDVSTIILLNKKFHRIFQPKIYDLIEYRTEGWIHDDDSGHVDVKVFFLHNGKLLCAEISAASRSSYLGHGQCLASIDFHEAQGNQRHRGFCSVIMNRKCDETYLAANNEESNVYNTLLDYIELRDSDLWERIVANTWRGY